MTKRSRKPVDNPFLGPTVACHAPRNVRLQVMQGWEKAAWRGLIILDLFLMILLTAGCTPINPPAAQQALQQKAKEVPAEIRQEAKQVKASSDVIEEQTAILEKKGDSPEIRSQVIATLRTVVVDLRKTIAQAYQTASKAKEVEKGVNSQQKQINNQDDGWTDMLMYLGGAFIVLAVAGIVWMVWNKFESTTVGLSLLAGGLSGVLICYALSYIFVVMAIILKWLMIGFVVIVLAGGAWMVYERIKTGSWRYLKQLRAGNR